MATESRPTENHERGQQPKQRTADDDALPDRNAFDPGDRSTAPSCLAAPPPMTRPHGDRRPTRFLIVEEFARCWMTLPIQRIVWRCLLGPIQHTSSGR